MVVAYLNLFLFGVPHFYLHQHAAGITLLLLNVLLFGFDLAPVAGVIDNIWLIVDLVMMPMWVNNERVKIAIIDMTKIEEKYHQI